MAARVFSACSTSLRDAGRALAPARDAKVLREALDQALERLGVDGAYANALRGEVAGTVAADGSATAAAGEARRSLARAERVLRAAVLRVDPDGLADGLGRVYRRARRAHRSALQEPTTEALHEWRKQVKNLWHALDVLEPLRPKRIGRWIAELQELAQQLGDEHDHALLAERVSPLQPTATTAALVEHLSSRRRRVSRRAFSLGERLFRQRPRSFVESVLPNADASAGGRSHPRR